MSLFTTVKFSEAPSLSLHIAPHRPSSFPFRLFFSSTSRSRASPPSQHPRSRASSSFSRSSAPWLQKWPGNPDGPPKSAASGDNIQKVRVPDTAGTTRYVADGDRGRSAIERIVLRLRNLGLVDDGEEQEVGVCGSYNDLPLDGEERLGDLLKRSWVRPDLAVDGGDDGNSLLPWEMDDGEYGEEQMGREDKRKRVKAPTLAELTIEDMELKRLRRDGIVLRERISIPKAGVTQAILEKIHTGWRKSELVRLKFHESLAHDMKTAHEIVERRTGGLVVWRSGSVMVVYRGANYKRPSKSQSMEIVSAQKSVQHDGDSLFVPDASSTNNLVSHDEDGGVSMDTRATIVKSPAAVENLMEDEKEFNDLLDGLGPRFVDWWGTGILPVDADLLPQQVPGYKTPFRFLPVNMRAHLTNAEMTSLRKLARSLPIHFALGRNRNHQGLAAAIVKLWEKSTVVKIAIKRGIQNTNNKLMAEELKNLTGGGLLLRNKYYIVIYRGKDFVPTSVAAALAERQELAKDSQDVEEKARIGVGVEAPAVRNHEEGPALAGTLAEFHEAQTRWGKSISSQELESLKEEALRAERSKLIKRIEHKLGLAHSKKLRAVRLLSKIEASMLPAEPSDDQETITEEERFMFRRIGLRMKAYLPLGIRGVFDGVIENMHLHWKHRELVKLISKQKTLSFVEDTARLLEYESGGILVAIERVPKGYALIYYRGKNYQRPINLRPRNLLTKAKALKRSVAMQRHEALSQHISELECKIEEMKSELGNSDVVNDSGWISDEDSRFGSASQYKSDDESHYLEKDDDGYGGSDIESED